MPTTYPKELVEANTELEDMSRAAHGAGYGLSAPGLNVGKILEGHYRQLLMEAVRDRALKQQELVRQQWLQQQLGTPPAPVPAQPAPITSGGAFVRG